MLDVVCLSNLCWYPVQNANLRWFMILWLICSFYLLSCGLLLLALLLLVQLLILALVLLSDLELQVTPCLLLGVIRVAWWNYGRTVCSCVY
jgi:hypothetical protein